MLTFIDEVNFLSVGCWRQYSHVQDFAMTNSFVIWPGKWSLVEFQLWSQPIFTTFWCFGVILTSPATELIVPQLDRANSKGNIKAPCYWPFIRGVHQSSVGARHKRPVKQTAFTYHSVILKQSPDSKVYGTNMEPIWGRQDPVGPHVGPMNLAIWVCALSFDMVVLYHTFDMKWLTLFDLLSRWCRVLL